jgi:hypothetical protein
VTTLPSLANKDPSELGFPPMLPMELAMNQASPKDICAEYGIDKDGWDALTRNPTFVHACAEARELAKAEGGSFRMKAKSMAEMLLKDLYGLATSDESYQTVPATVRADVMKFIVRVAGLDASIDQKGAASAKAGAQATAIINIDLG